MRPTQAPYLFNGALNDLLDITEATPAYCTAQDILTMDKIISEIERAAKTLRDCYDSVKKHQSFTFEKSVIHL